MALECDIRLARRRFSGLFGNCLNGISIALIIHSLDRIKRIKGFREGDCLVHRARFPNQIERALRTPK